MFERPSDSKLRVPQHLDGSGNGLLVDGIKRIGGHVVGLHGVVMGQNGKSLSLATAPE